MQVASRLVHESKSTSLVVFMILIISIFHILSFILNMRNRIVYCFEEGRNFHRYFPCLDHVRIFIHKQCHHHILHRSNVNTKLIIEKIHCLYLLFLSDFCVVSVGLSESGDEHG